MESCARPALLASTLVVVGAAFLAAVSSVRAERWSAWKTKPDAPFVARFEPSVDTRSTNYQNNRLDSYADLSKRIPFPGTLVLETAAGGAGIAPGTSFVIVVEAVFVDEDHSGAPKVPKDAHFAFNPLLPFGTPSGSSRPPFSTIVSFARVPDSGEVARIPVFLPFLSWRSADGIVRIRWSAVEAGGGRLLARGVLPGAFFGQERVIVDATGDGSANTTETPGHPTSATWTAWPTLASDITSIVFDGTGFDAAFGAAPGPVASNFAARARLVGVSLVSRDEATAARLASIGANQGRDVLVPWMRSGSSGDATPLVATQVGRQSTDYIDSDPARRRAELAANEALLEPARIPGATLGRAQAPFVVATVAFLALFAVGAVVILVRYFARRKGEARLAVWHALPLWSAAMAAVAFLALPHLLDRRPYADVTEWRYGFADSDEAFCIARARVQSFAATPSAWSIPADAWFDFSAYRASSRTPSMTYSLGGNAGPTFAMLPERQRGEMEAIDACRFAPHRSPVSLTPDPALDVAAFVREALLAPGAEGSDAASRAALSAMLTDWSAPPSGPPERPLRPAPERTVTAAQDLDGVFVWARGVWYALGPMKAGESCALAPHRRVWRGMAAHDKPWHNLFDEAPFAVVANDVTSFANAWLAREGGEDGDKIRNYDKKEVARLVRKLGSAFVVAIQGARPNAAPFLAPVFPGGPESGQTTERIVFMEVFP